MEKLIQFIADNGDIYNIDLATVMSVMTAEEMNSLGNQGNEAMETFFAEEFDSLFDLQLSVLS